MRILHYAAIIANVSQQQSGQTSLGHPLEFQSGNSKDKTVITNPERERERERCPPSRQTGLLTAFRALKRALTVL